MKEIAVFLKRERCISCESTGFSEIASGSFDTGLLSTYILEDPWGEHPSPFLIGRPWRYVECQACKLRFHQYILDATWNERRFSKWMSQEAIEAFEKPLRTTHTEFTKAMNYARHALQIHSLAGELSKDNPLSILDFGCGYGGFLNLCSTFGFDAVGIDRATAKRDNNKHSKVYASISEIKNFKPFHALTLFEVLEHLDDPKSLLIELSALLMDEGILVIETPDCSGVNGINNRNDYSKIHPLEHINGFTPKTQKAFVEALGYVEISIPFSCVANSPFAVAKRTARHVLQPLLKSTTRQYFRKLKTES
jgi:2-polyprenyl-3-methyl-5-hydroxy-6-metoxy-1,4-benzoquinol methylase